MASNASAATDLGALLQQSIDSGFNGTASAHASGQMPVQLAPYPTSGVQAVTPSYVPPAPASTARPIVVEAPPVMAQAPAKKKSGVLGIVLGAVVLAGAMGGGAVWYVHHHQATIAASLAAQQAPVANDAPPVAKDAPPPAEAKVEVPVIVTPPAEANAGTKTEEVAAPDTTAQTKTDTKSAKRTHRSSAPTKVAEAPKPVAKAAQPEKAPEAPKAAPPPKAAGGAVDAVLQQQLSGAL